MLNMKTGGKKTTTKQSMFINKTHYFLDGDGDRNDEIESEYIYLGNKDMHIKSPVTSTRYHFKKYGEVIKINKADIKYLSGMVLLKKK